MGENIMKLSKMEEEFLDTKTPADFLNNQYKFALRNMSIAMPMFSALFAIIGIVLTFVFINSFWWIGLIFIGMGLLTLGWFFLVRAFIKAKMVALSEHLAQKDE